MQPQPARHVYAYTPFVSSTPTNTAGAKMKQWNKNMTSLTENTEEQWNKFKGITNGTTWYAIPANEVQMS